MSAPIERARPARGLSESDGQLTQILRAAMNMRDSPAGSASKRLDCRCVCQLSSLRALHNGVMPDRDVTFDSAAESTMLPHPAHSGTAETGRRLSLPRTSPQVLTSAERLGMPVGAPPARAGSTRQLDARPLLKSARARPQQSARSAHLTPESAPAAEPACAARSTNNSADT